MKPGNLRMMDIYVATLRPVSIINKININILRNGDSILIFK